MAKNVFQSPKGTKDVLPEEQNYWAFIGEMIHHIVKLYGYEKLDLPVFEETALFQRGVGEGTDIVEKEMYTFMDKGENSMTMRPEFTAGVMRAYIQHGMSSLPKPVKLWSMGPVFRYERPQAGRYRQHTQFNVEALGDQDPALDFEVMSIAWHLYNELGFQNLNFQINSIGCKECRPNYIDKLVEYYKNHIQDICDDCKRRLKQNPLRLLDCKNQQCQSFIDNSPPVVDLLCNECNEHFSTLKSYLQQGNKSYNLNNRLVRGLDYYTKTVFEVWAQGIGSQSAVCGGGRYDGLAEVLGGQETPGVGFASGLERIVLTLQHQKVDIPEVDSPQIYLASQGENAKIKIVEILSLMRAEGIGTIMGFGNRSLKAQLREANRRLVQYTIILGENEFKEKKVLVKKMEGGEQELIAWNDLIHHIKKSGVK
jgi:histidyl-tRNA synthetase